MNAILDTGLDTGADTGSQAKRGGAKIIITAYGSLGVVHPCLAIGLALKARGFAPLLALSASHCAKVTNAGLDAVAITPSVDEVAATAAAELGITPAEAIGRALEDQDFFIHKVLLDYLEPSIAALEEHLAGAVAIVSARQTLAGPILAEKYGIPFFELHLQPMALLSVDDPPFAKGMEVLTRLPVKPLRRAWNRAWIALFLKVLHRRYAPRVNAARAKFGLAKLTSTPFFQINLKPVMSLGLWSSAFAPIPADFAGALQLTGFPGFDSESGQNEALDEGLQAFLANGSPPLVFTLGSLAVNAPGSFYTASLEAARAMGLRAVFLVGENELPAAPDIIVRDYVAHSLLFPHAAAIIHHGGMGTTAQALRHGIPQLVVPHFLDQPDNGRRIQQLGVGDVVNNDDYTSVLVAEKLRSLLGDGAVKARAVQIAAAVADEDGGAYAANLIAARLPVPGSQHIDQDKGQYH